MDTFDRLTYDEDAKARDGHSLYTQRLISTSPAVNVNANTRFRGNPPWEKLRLHISLDRFYLMAPKSPGPKGPHSCATLDAYPFDGTVPPPALFHSAGW
jgi:hypothetical protein